MGDGPAQSIPTVTSPSNNVVQVVWSGAQTSILLNGTYTWALQIDVDAAGPFSLVAGNLQMGNPTTPGVATSATADITVLVGTATANLDLTLDGGSGSGSITDITSNDHSITVTNPTGPIVDLSAAASVAGVASFNTRTGAVTASSGDYTVSQVTGAAPLASPALTGTPTAPTKTPGTNNTDIATTAYTDLGIGVETTRATAAEALLAPKASPALTGTPTAPTATVGTNTTQIASTAFVLANAGSGAVSSVFGRTGTVTATSGDYTVGQVTGAQAGPLTGDVTTSGAAATLKNTGPGATGPIGDGTHVATVTIDAQGRVTGLTSTAITTGGSGTVTSASVVSANGFAGTVATATSTPAITLSTTITGLLKGNGTAISAASAGTDYVTPTGSGATLTGITAAQVSALAIANNLADLNDAGSGRFNLSSPILLGCCMCGDGKRQSIGSRCDHRRLYAPVERRGSTDSPVDARPERHLDLERCELGPHPSARVPFRWRCQAWTGLPDCQRYELCWDYVLAGCDRCRADHRHQFADLGISQHRRHCRQRSHYSCQHS